MLTRLVLMMMLTLPVVALESVSVGGSDQNALKNAELKAGNSISVLTAGVDDARTRAANAQASANAAQGTADSVSQRLAQFESCANQGRLYVPGTGCKPVGGALSNVRASHYCVFSTGRQGNWFNGQDVVTYSACVLPPVTCPSGTKIVSCTGGGELEFANNRCVTNVPSNQQTGTTAPKTYFGNPIPQTCRQVRVGGGDGDWSTVCDYNYAGIGGHTASYQATVEAICMAQ
ncbi:MAG: hypothetical protein COY40_06775 [Alphaproteobacteria bacterium CG_4_10_14_0_8_um_filter_53_9]|nr:MAG: hypothetical protein COY40_06775 [Alphaproteobacteria bacterium CG_4_10_14_0_8_um_filter_53_9]